MTGSDNRPTIELVESEPAALPGPWWWSARFLGWASGVALAGVVGVAVAALFGWSATALSIAGLVLDSGGVALIAAPFASRALIRVRHDRAIRGTSAEIEAHERDMEAYEEGRQELQRQIDEGRQDARVRVPDIEPRNSMAEYLYEQQAEQRSRLAVPEREAASFILGGTATAVMGFCFQMFGQLV